MGAAGITVVTGGARSGKSTLAVQWGRRYEAAGGSVTFVATSPRIPGDADLKARVARHRAERPATWRTVEEELDLAGAVAAAGGSLMVVDCLTLWVSNLVYHGRTDAMEANAAAIDTCRRRAAPTVVVTNEVGLGIVPADAATREYRDLLGRINQAWVAASDAAWFMVAGRALPLQAIDDAGPLPVRAPEA